MSPGLISGSGMEVSNCGCCPPGNLFKVHARVRANAISPLDGPELSSAGQVVINQRPYSRDPSMHAVLQVTPKSSSDSKCVSKCIRVTRSEPKASNRGSLDDFRRSVAR